MKKSAVVLTLGLAMAMSSCGEKKDNNSNNNKPATVKPVDTNTDTNTDASTDANTDANTNFGSCTRDDIGDKKCADSKILRCLSSDDGNEFVWKEIDNCGTNKCITFEDDDGDEEVGCSCDPATFVPDASKNDCSDSGYQSVKLFEFSHQICKTYGNVGVITKQNDWCTSCSDGQCHVTDVAKGLNAEAGDTCIPVVFNSRCDNNTIYNCAAASPTEGIVVKSTCSSGCATTNYDDFSAAYCKEYCNGSELEHADTFMVMFKNDEGCGTLVHTLVCEKGSLIPYISLYGFSDVSDDKKECSLAKLSCDNPDEAVCQFETADCHDPDKESSEAVCSIVGSACSDIRQDMAQGSLYDMTCNEQNNYTMCSNEDSSDCVAYKEHCEYLSDLNQLQCFSVDNFDLTLE